MITVVEGSKGRMLQGEGQALGAAELAGLLRAAGGEERFATSAWVANHYRWVVWKLACAERGDPARLAGRLLTVPVVLDQLKYRSVMGAARWMHAASVNVSLNNLERAYKHTHGW